MKKIFFIVMGIAILILVITGFLVVKNFAGEKNIQIEDTKKLDFLQQGFGELCSGEKECQDFCVNNRGQCEEYCKNNENELCRKIFSFVNKEIKIDNENEIAKEDKPPVLQNLGVTIEDWNKQTNRAGDLIFDKRIIYDDGRVANDKVFLEFGAKDKYRVKDYSVEYWFFMPLGTKVHSPVNGITHIGFINHSKDWGINIQTGKNIGWFVSFEHMINLSVTEGDVVKVGDVLGETSPRNTINYEIGMTEFAVWNSNDNHIIKYCPTEFLDNSLKPVYEEKLKRLASDWEEYIGKDVYQQENWVAPGCLAHSIQEK